MPKLRTPEYHTYNGMIQRCHNPNHKSYSYYGGRGIQVCERWRGKGGFQRFLTDMGPRGEGLTLDREKCDEDYCPENCRWATWSEQGKNRRSWAKPKDLPPELIDSKEELFRETGLNI